MLTTVITKANRPQELDFDKGFMMLVDKPLDWTSFDVVNKLRFSCKHKLSKKKYKVGHAGTLDPLATGLLIICCGKYTKKIDQLQILNKSYDFQIKLGYKTKTYDAEAPEIFVSDVNKITISEVVNSLNGFRGDILQRPPIYSAIKVKGEALYKLARRGEDIEIKSRPVHISKLELIKFANPLVDLRMSCTKGTYVRSLANDIGEVLGCGAYVTNLRRTEIGQYSADQALSLQECVDFIAGVTYLQNPI